MADGPPVRYLVQFVSTRLVREERGLHLPHIQAPQHLANAAAEYLADLDQEHILVITLNTKLQPTAVLTAAVGSLCNSNVGARDVLKAAILNAAPAILLVHNHPSGDPTPSPEDVKITKDLQTAADLFEIEILDHVIIGAAGNYTSLKERGLI